ncbi:ATP-binding protein [Occultella gossypii]|uniref:ATP-binding protein n=1 Tax=Occultella gossypii TaxID=2800820 RepID=UPI001CBE74A8|nr:ATP-binding protein [Occultella gossypii]
MTTTQDPARVESPRASGPTADPERLPAAGAGGPGDRPEGEASITHLLGRLGVIEERIRGLVTQRRAHDPQPDDPFRGLYLSDEAVEAILERRPELPLSTTASARLTDCERTADTAQRSGARLRLREVADRFGLDALDVDLLLLALAADVDPRFGQLFGYLNDDVTRRRPTVATALTLCGRPLGSGAARAHLVHGPLISGRLVQVDDADQPLPVRTLRIPDRVAAHLLGDDNPDPALVGALVSAPDAVWGDVGPVARALAAGVDLIHVREAATGSGRLLAIGALRELGRDAVVLDLQHLAEGPEPAELVDLAVREAMLGGAGLVAGPVEALGEVPSARIALTGLAGRRGLPVLLVGTVPWDPAWAPRTPLLVDAPASTDAERAQLWALALSEPGAPVNADAPSVAGDAEPDADATFEEEALDVAAATSQYRLNPEQVVRAARAAQVQARLDGGRLAAEHLRRGARAENGTALDRLARRIEPAVGWEDLVLPSATLTGLRELSLRARHRERVLGDWRMRPGGGRGHGVAALFAGDSGTGKTMSAEVVAGDLGLELYVVDLATVVDKYIGETEKNLERIFAGAARMNAVLLFDEADAVFGKRSEVKDAHDRYANVESAYLLQRIESFDGLLILTTNLRANIDDAFTRRLDVLVDFPLPDPTHRLALWDRCLGTVVPRADDLDLAFCADAFALAGGAIRSSAVTAAYLAAADGAPLGMGHLVTAVQREYRKMGRLSLPAEFGRYWDLIG